MHKGQNKLEDAIKNGIRIAKDNHVQRLRNATCKIDSMGGNIGTGFFLNII